MTADSAAVEEWPVWLEVNGEPVVTWMCTPDQLEELAAGWLHGEGYIESVDDLLKLRPCATDLGFWADVRPEGLARVKAENRRRVLASGCGAVTTLLADPHAVPRAVVRGEPPAVEQLRTLFKALFARGSRYNETGGIHAAALTDAAALLFHAEDIGRHNAVDKVIGAAVLARRPIAGLGLLVTGAHLRGAGVQGVARGPRLGGDAERTVHVGPGDRATLGDGSRGTRGERVAARPPAGRVTADALRTLLRNARTVAVVGLSPDPTRPSHSVASYLQGAGFRIVPVNPHHASILGERCYPTLAAAARDHSLDIVDVFRRSAFAGGVVDEALALRPPPRLIWLQQGVVDPAAAERARSAGVPFVMDRCLAVDHQLLEVA
jgi:formate dehydrogenase accessory protein FdhD